MSSSGGSSQSGGSEGTSRCLDVFGRTMFYETAAGGPIWDSAYWSSSAHEVPFKTPDEADPRRLANQRGTGEVRVNGDGTLSMTGDQPRLYLGTSEDHPFLNVEITVYYQRIEDDNTAWGGLVVGARSGPDGHGDDNCTASTYYARMRHDGGVDLAKELEHPTSLARFGQPIWDGAELPKSQWIGMKYIVTNEDSVSVRLQVLVDVTEGHLGGTWELLLDERDEGGWAPEHDCSFADDHIILQGGGVVFIRDTGLTGAGALYRDMTVVEVDPNRSCTP